MRGPNSSSGWSARRRLRISEYSLSVGSARHVRYPPCEEAPLGLLLGKVERAFVECSGFSHSSQSPAQVGPRRVSEVVVGEVAAIQDILDQDQPGLRSVSHRNRHGAVQLDHGRRDQAYQQVVEADDLRPVRSGDAWRLRVHRRDGRLDGVRAEPAGRQRPPHQCRSFYDLLVVPQRAVLFLERDQFAFERSTRIPARVLK